DVGYLLGAMRGVERRVDFGEVPDIRSVQDGGAELDRLDRILAAMARKRAADEDDGSEPVDEAKLPQRVDDIDVVFSLWQPTARAERRGQATGAGNLGDARPAIGMARRDQGEELRERAPQAPVRLDQGGFLARMGRGRRNGGALSDRRLQRPQAFVLGRRLRHVELEVAGRADARRTKIAIAGGVGGRLGKTEIEKA